ncbi:MAG: Holliday junction branch migration protein RuvA [Myxococcales bacterium]|jgi:Holliday junction DNA helicase RuvA|nr:Holliday junction branch migration protein RuvA [Myxococcales bacterium]
MIASLQGTLSEKRLDEVVIDVHGVGYRVAISLMAQARLPPEGDPIALRIRTIVREDALDLYGFLTVAEEDLFRLLMSVSQVGPKAAMNILSGLEPGDLAKAIASGDTGRLTKLHGVGKKTAERIVLELKDKVTPLLPDKATGQTGGGPMRIERAISSRESDLVTALTSLGYKPAQAERLADKAEQSLGKDATIESLVKEALRLARG